ncbi:MAG: hypothetical protein C4533_05120 [Candidatus Omnitrophota bacterium]|jgi:Mg/Co/Ni transporter MgtE|nr:MAG: hypothetical protein C4533_05120 [Candidatus Omnitrophota bacterium]
MYGDYKVLSIAPKVFKTLAWIGLVLGVISALIIFAGMATPETPRWMGLVTLIVGAIYFFIFTVAAEVVDLLLDMNARIK